MQSGLNSFTLPEKLWGARALAALFDREEHRFLIASCNAQAASQNAIHEVVYSEDSNRVYLKCTYPIEGPVNAIVASPYSESQILVQVADRVCIFKMLGGDSESRSLQEVAST